MTNTTSNNTLPPIKHIPSNVPAYIKTKFRTKCSCCAKYIEMGVWAFYQKGSPAQLWHRNCGLEAWRGSGTPYAKVIALAIKHKKVSKPSDIENDMGLSKQFLVEVEEALDIWRGEPEGTVLGRDLPVDRESQIMTYLLEHELVEGNIHYTLTDKGKAWSWKSDIQ